MADKGKQILLHCIQARCQSLMKLGNLQQRKLERKLQIPKKNKLVLGFQKQFEMASDHEM